MTDREKILSKLKKLFALGSSPNQHEAEAALAMASKIMEEHQIAEADIDLSKGSPIADEYFTIQKSSINIHALMILAQSSAELFDGRAGHVVTKTKDPIFKFWGQKTDIEAMKMTFVYLHRSWLSIVNADFKLPENCDKSIGSTKNKRIFRTNHAMGFAVAINLRVRRLLEERRANVAASTGRDLVLAKSAAVGEIVNGKIKTARKSRFSPNKTAFLLGHNRGKEIPLSSAIQHAENHEAA